MKYKIILFAFFLGILIGVTIFASPAAQITGSSVTECYVENELCECDAIECVCGENVVPKEYCKSSGT